MSESCFSGMIEYPRSAVVEEVGSDSAKRHWFLLLMFLCLPLTIWLSLVLVLLSLTGGFPFCMSVGL